ncbi:MAG: hypothetical protein JSW08_01285 [archaeon]|nr:MAG: hypothetical protein JSW08_01285 [archaeon]
MYDLKEIVFLVIAAVVTSFFLSAVFPTLALTSEFGVTFLLMLIIFFIFTAAQKLVAYGLDADSKVKLMTFNQYGFRSNERMGFDFPVWLILPLVLFFITAGKFVWTSILNFQPEALKTRVGRKFAELTEVDVAKIAMAGPLALLVFGLIMRAVGFNSYATICVLTAFLALLPIGNGTKIFAGMRITSVFLMVLGLGILILMHLTNVVSTIVIALIIAVAFIITYYALWEK